MTDATSGIPTVTFGKYRGRPVEDMLADAGYVAWLSAQPWFREKFSHLLTRRDADAASRTPEHNRLQALFLSEDYCWAFAHVADPKGAAKVRAFNETATAASVSRILKAAVESEETAVKYESHPASSRAVWIEDYPAKNRAKAAALRRLAEAEHTLPGSEAAFATFEDKGADVRICLCAEQECHHPARWDRTSFQKTEEAHRLALTVEIKPVVADDFPAVLRQMNRNDSKYLFVDRYDGEGATEQQFIAMFAASGKRVVFKRDVDAKAAEAAA